MNSPDRTVPAAMFGAKVSFGGTRAALELARELGAKGRRLALLGEGNVSVRVSTRQFRVKASGAHLGTLRPEELVACRLATLQDLLDAGALKDSAVEAAVLASRFDLRAARPSVEAVFHAYLLGLPGIRFVGHTHPVAVNAILCSPAGRQFAQRRLFPDEVVCCGAASVWIPYCDPGLTLARNLRRAVEGYLARHGAPPRVILLQNHGLIALGATARGVLAATLMANKAAEVFLGSSVLGGPRFLTPAAVRRISGRPDEAHRRAVLGLAQAP